MATFTLKVDTDNAAFADDPAPELARILRLVAERIEAGDEFHYYQTIRDANGNDVGRYALKNADGSPARGF